MLVVRYTVTKRFHSAYTEISRAIITGKFEYICEPSDRQGRASLNTTLKLLSPLRSWFIINQRSPQLGWKSEQKFDVFPPQYKRKTGGLAT